MDSDGQEGQGGKIGEYSPPANMSTSTSKSVDAGDAGEGSEMPKEGRKYIHYMNHPLGECAICSRDGAICSPKCVQFREHNTM